VTDLATGDARFEGEAALAAACSAEMPWLAARLPRLDAGTRLALLAVSRAASSGVPIRDAASVLLWLAVEEGSADADRAYWATAAPSGGAYASPALFAATLPSAVAAEVASGFGLLGPCVVVTGRGTSPLLPSPGVARTFGADRLLAVEVGPGRARAILR